jgi:hypothetical protein
MIDAADVPSVDPGETLARYVVYQSHIRRSNWTIKPDAFMPHPHRDLSLTRHRDATEEELWTAGQQVAASQGKTLQGRGDIAASTCIGQGLTVEARPLPENPNHADVVGWPADKPAQKIIAQEIAATSRFVAPPGSQ